MPDPTTGPAYDGVGFLGLSADDDNILTRDGTGNNRYSYLSALPGYGATKLVALALRRASAAADYHGHKELADALWFLRALYDHASEDHASENWLAGVLSPGVHAMSIGYGQESFAALDKVARSFFRVPSGQDAYRRDWRKCVARVIRVMRLPPLRREEGECLLGFAARLKTPLRWFLERYAADWLATTREGDTP
jgi:hypothetical protein